MGLSSSVKMKKRHTVSCLESHRQTEPEVNRSSASFKCVGHDGEYPYVTVSHTKHGTEQDT